jgi:phage gp45-like
VLASEAGFWQVEGYDGERTSDLEVFQNVGYTSRPKAGSDGEVILGRVGAKSGHPVVLAARDRTTEPTIDPDETAIHNSLALVYIKDDGTIEARTKAGAAVSLALKSDVQTIRNELDGHAHTYLPGSGGATQTTGNPSVTSPVGTTKLKGE